jgi:hypothetical protein
MSYTPDPTCPKLLFLQCWSDPVCVYVCVSLCICMESGYNTTSLYNNIIIDYTYILNTINIFKL